MQAWRYFLNSIQTLVSKVQVRLFKRHQMMLLEIWRIKNPLACKEFWFGILILNVNPDQYWIRLHLNESYKVFKSNRPCCFHTHLYILHYSRFCIHNPHLFFILYVFICRPSHLQIYFIVYLSMDPMKRAEQTSAETLRKRKSPSKRCWLCFLADGFGSRVEFSSVLQVVHEVQWVRELIYECYNGTFFCSICSYECSQEFTWGLFSSLRPPVMNDGMFNIRLVLWQSSYIETWLIEMQRCLNPSHVLFSWWRLNTESACEVEQNADTWSDLGNADVMLRWICCWKQNGSGCALCLVPEDLHLSWETITGFTDRACVLISVSTQLFLLKLLSRH